MSALLQYLSNEPKSDWWGVELVTAPAQEPVGITEVKDWCRIDHDDQNSILNRLMVSARTHVEREIGRVLISQTWRLWLNAWPPERDRIKLPKPPLVSVSSVKYKDSTEAETTLSATTDYITNPVPSGYAEVVLRYSQFWPTALLSPSRPISIEFVCGYGTAPSSVPDSILHAMLMLVGHWYKNPEAVVSSGTIARELPRGVKSLLAPYKVEYYRPW